MTVRAEVRVIPPTPVEPEREVTLTMPYAVAQSLRAVVGNIPLNNGPLTRLGDNDLDQIWKALNAAGVETDQAKNIIAGPALFRAR